MAIKLTINQLNDLSKSEFQEVFRNIVECYPDVGNKLETLRPFQNINNILEEAHQIISLLDEKEKEKILQLHPDLAGKLAQEGQLTNESLREQAAAGLSNITNDDKVKLNDLNQQYFQKFGFPFVICARENKFNAILEGIKIRVQNQKNTELATGIEEVKKICRLRILDLIENNL